MKLSTKTRYGLRALIDLTIHYGEGGVLLKDIADRQEVSLKYLSHIISTLNTSGIVTNVRRRRGGYVLSRAPSEITAYEVFRALEGSLELVECVDDPKVCDWANFCALRRLCTKLNDSMTSVLQGVTLADLAQEEQERRGQTTQDNKEENILNNTKRGDK